MLCASVQTNGGAKAPAEPLRRASGETPAAGEEAAGPAAEAPAEKALGAKPLEKTGSAILGDIVWLLMQSPRHKHLFLADLEWLVMPPVALKQFKVFYADRRPVAVALWASVSEEVERTLEAGEHRLKPSEWSSGERLWLIDLVAPTVARRTELMRKLVAELGSSVFAGRPFKATRAAKIAPDKRMEDGDAESGARYRHG